MRRFCLVLIVACAYLGCSVCQGETTKINNETAAQEFLTKYDQGKENVGHETCVARFNMQTNITKANREVLSEKAAQEAKYDAAMAEKASKFDLSLGSALSNDSRRQLKIIVNKGSAPEGGDEVALKLQKVTAQMDTIYSTATVCLKKNDCYDLDPGLSDIMSNSRDYDKLKTVWKKWRDATGRKMKDLYVDYVKFGNLAMRKLGYEDIGDYMRSGYESPTFEHDILLLFAQVQPLYEQVHAFVRRRLKEFYGEDKFPKSGHIPAHLLGNMWGERWLNIADIVTPFKDKLTIDLTDTMVKQNYTVNKIYHTAEDFFVSLGFDKMVPTFWNLSMMEKPTDGREVICHPMAIDCKNGKDFRIKMCTDVTQHDLLAVHHEMGHIEYFMEYKDQPTVYREGANPGFHEAVGDVITLSVQTPEHLQTIGLLKDFTDDKESDLNFLMHIALQKVAFIPFGYLLDHWRWSVYRNDTQPKDYNKSWWEMRCRHQGIAPPVERTSDDFDPGSKYHVASRTPYIRYFVAFIIQFQFHKAACDAAGYKGPLHRCDIYKSKEAGNIMKNMLELGSSKPWPEAMEKITGQRQMDAGPFLEYFKPLFDFLQEENKNDYGWDPHCPDNNDNNNKNKNNNNGTGRIKLSLTVIAFVSLFGKMIL